MLHPYKRGALMSWLGSLYTILTIQRLNQLNTTTTQFDNLAQRRFHTTAAVEVFHISIQYLTWYDEIFNRTSAQIIRQEKQRISWSIVECLRDLLSYHVIVVTLGNFTIYGIGRNGLRQRPKKGLERLKEYIQRVVVEVLTPTLIMSLVYVVKTWNDFI